MSVVEPLSSLTNAAASTGGGDAARPFVRGPLRPVALASTRTRISSAAATRMFALLDAGVVVGCIIVVESFRHGGLWGMTFADVAPVLFGSWLILATLGAANVHAFGPRRGLAGHLLKIAGVVLCALLAACLVALANRSQIFKVFEWGAVTATGLLASHTVWWSQARAWRAAGRMTPNIVVVGATANARKLIQSCLETRDVAVLGVFDDRLGRSPGAVDGVPVLGDTAALLAHPLLPYVDRIVITVTPSAQARVRYLIDRLSVLPNAITLFMDAQDADGLDAALTRLADNDADGLVDAEKRAFDKRLQDLVIAPIALAIAAPLMVLIGLAVALDSPGPVFFRQRRHGFNNETITVWKFRSMRTEVADATASRQVSENDDRVTRVGRVIRKLSLDELPQLFNVLSGEMSLVGPRPHAIGMKTAGKDSARLVAEYAWRHRMKPGLTGWAQINGSIGAIDTAEAVRRRVTLDVEYIETQSFWLDLYILAMTVPALIRSRNVAR